MEEKKTDEKKKVQPQKKGSSTLLVGGIFVGVVLLLLLVGLGYFLFWDQKTKAEELINQVDKHWERANELFILAEAFEIPQDVGTIDFEEWAEENQKNAIEAKKELELVREKLEEVKTLRIRDWMQEYARKREEATNEKIKGLEIFERWINRIARRSNPLEKLYQARKKYDEGLLTLNKTISLLNKDKFSEAKKEAQKAQTLFKSTKKLLSEASQKDKSLEIDPLIQATQKEIERSLISTNLAEEQKKDVDKYNQLIDQANKARKEGEKFLAKGKKLFDNPLRWYRTKLLGLEKESLKHLARANQLEEEAIEIWNENI